MINTTAVDPTSPNFVPIDYSATTWGPQVTTAKIKPPASSSKTLIGRIQLVSSFLAFYPVLKIIIAGFALSAFALSPLNIVLLAAIALALLAAFLDWRNNQNSSKCMRFISGIAIVPLSVIVVPMTILVGIKNLFKKKEFKVFKSDRAPLVPAPRYQRTSAVYSPIGLVDPIHINY